MTVMTPAFAATATSNGLLDRYRAMLDGHQANAAQWLETQLSRADQLPDDLPDTLAQLGQWSVRHSADVAREYAAYLKQRQQGAPRRYFSNRSQAIWFLQQVAPTKAVDGAWLQGTLKHWADPRYHDLIRTYLEELGNGDPRCNHVLIYQRLLSRLGCQEPVLSDERYLQGSLQLALGQHSDRFLPEVIGYNLGYEQPPLHLLITTYELAELGIDGYYFQLHITIDNAASGHAQKSIQALQQLCPRGEEAEFYSRVRRGYRLNDLGVDTPSLIASFNLDEELFTALEQKSLFGQFMHADRCRLQKRTINQWLSEPGAMPDFVAAMEQQEWIRRGEDPANSRWWKLIEGPTAPMFGVFTPYEKQLWHDWIAADWQAPVRRVLPGAWEGELALEVPRLQSAGDPDVGDLIERMLGNRHATPDGLLATRNYLLATGLAQEEPR
ncbi:iron-containing redox enzyme family protein [Pseudomonas sp.]|uniref:iron-containing redox enzyme family protein n=1 Tax=Pseudomonas sp. TaxID=306 RepID=UPI0028AF7408|nr:iron-containing redox enzyme family protein [Pseudomonas sp.]